MKVVINSCYGGFELSDPAFEKLLDRKGIAWEKQINSYKTAHDYYSAGHLGNEDNYLFFNGLIDDRGDQDLVAVVEELGEASDGPCAKLKIIDVPDDVKWHIEEYDGLEWIAEDHRTWE